MEKILVLDHGYVRKVETWGSDERIIEAARMSTQKGFEGWGFWECSVCKTREDTREDFVGNLYTACPQCGCDKDPIQKHGDERLLAYLWKNNHATPFEMAGMIVEVQAPIFVFREWHRHRAAGYNEASARYAPLPAIDYVPTVERSIRGGGHLTKQAASASDVVFTVDDAREMRADFEDHYARTESLYQKWLKRGAPKELARIPLAVGRYSKMRATSNLRMWLHFLGLRNDPKAQWEIRQYAEVVQEMITDSFPRTLSLFNEGRK